MQAKAGGIDSARVQVRAKRLLQHCLDAFVANRHSPELQQPPQRSLKFAPWLNLLNVFIKLTGKLDSLIGFTFRIVLDAYLCMCTLCCLSSFSRSPYITWQTAATLHSVQILGYTYSACLFRAMSADKYTSVHLSYACVADPRTWQPAVGVSEASLLVASLMGFLATKCSLFPSLARLLLVACPPVTLKQQPQPQQQQQQQHQQQSAMSIPETLASNLTVRFLSLKRFPEVAAAQASLAKLLCVPLLWLRCSHVLLNVGSLPKLSAGTLLSASALIASGL